MATLPPNPHWTVPHQSGFTSIARPPVVTWGLICLFAAAATWGVAANLNAAFSRMALADEGAFDFERDVIDVVLGLAAVGLAVSAVLLWRGRMMAWPFVVVLTLAGTAHGLRLCRYVRGARITSEYDTVHLYQLGAALLIIAFTIVGLALLCGNQAQQWRIAHRQAKAHAAQYPGTRY